eukprot:3228411-Pyramimonas_sp.AAC.1
MENSWSFVGWPCPLSNRGPRAVRYRSCASLRRALLGGPVALPSSDGPRKFRWHAPARFPGPRAGAMRAMVGGRSSI